MAVCGGGCGMLCVWVVVVGGGQERKLSVLLQRNRSASLLRSRSMLLLRCRSALLLYRRFVLGIWVVTFVLVILGVVVFSKLYGIPKSESFYILYFITRYCIFCYCESKSIIM